MRYSLLILSAFLVISSCTKVEEPISKQDKLRAEKWILDVGFIRVIQKADGGAVPYSIDRKTKMDIPECRQDDVLVFRDGYEGAHVPGEKTCSINETSDMEFRWGLTDNDTKMFINDAKEYFTVDVDAEIIEFYDDKFAIKYSSYLDKAVTNGDDATVWLRDTTIYTMYFKKYVPPVE